MIVQYLVFCLVLSSWIRYTNSITRTVCSNVIDTIGTVVDDASSFLRCLLQSTSTVCAKERKEGSNLKFKRKKKIFLKFENRSCFAHRASTHTSIVLVQPSLGTEIVTHRMNEMKFKKYVLHTGKS